MGLLIEQRFLTKASVHCGEVARNHTTLCLRGNTRPCSVCFMAHFLPTPCITRADAQDSRWCLGGVDAVPIERVLPADAALLPTSARDWQASLLTRADGTAFIGSIGAALCVRNSQTYNDRYMRMACKWPAVCAGGEPDGCTWSEGCHLWSRMLEHGGRRGCTPCTC